MTAYRRKSQFGKCPYEIAMKIFPEEFFDLLGLYQIMDTEVELTPKLIKKSRKGEVQLAAPTIEAVMPKIEVPDMPLGQCHFISQD